MTRTGTLVATVSRCALLAALFCATQRAAAQTSDGWSATRDSNSVGADNYAPSDWQPSRPAQAARPPRSESKPQADVEDAGPTRWVEPTRAKTPPAPAKVPAATAQQSELPSKRKPKPFVAPTNAQQLAQSVDEPKNQPQPRTTTPKSAADKRPVNTKNANLRESAQPQANDPPPAPRNAANRPATGKSNAPTTQTNNSQARRVDPAKNGNSVAYDSSRPPSRADSIRAKVRQTSQDDSLDSRTSLNPLRQVAYHMEGGEELPPGHSQSMPSMPMSSGGGSMMMGPSDGQWIDSDACCDGSCPSGECVDGCGPACGDYIGCGDTCGCGSECGDDPCEICNIGPGDDESCHQVRIRVPKFQEVMVFGGVHGFKGPLDQDRNSGNFGFQEGFNVGAKLPYTDFGYQFGYAATESQLSGDSNTGTTDAFTQSFFTAGVFHRTCDGFQGGLAWDIMHDDRDSSSDFEQLRGEFSFVDQGCHELGVMGSVHLGSETFTRFDDNEDVIHTRFQATDQFLLFYRMHGCRGGEGRAFAGISDNSDAIVGADFLLPLHCSWSLQSEFTYLIPDNGAGAIGARQEAWNISIAMVWHWYGQARECHSNPYRPLFNVADNGSMIIDDRP